MALADKVDIANLALQNIGISTTIESFTENSNEAQTINRAYDQARRVALEAFDWGFARARITLTQHAEDAPATDWAYRYQYPTGAIIVRRLTNPLGPKNDKVPFAIEVLPDDEQKTIVTDLEDAEAVYTADISNTELFSEHFVESLAAQIAVRIAYPLTKKRSVRSDAISAFQDLIKRAPAHDANESGPRTPRDAPWIEARDA